jgi:membrane-bound metal-dependent hydrolase YbcI (DUF457 family)
MTGQTHMIVGVTAAFLVAEALHTTPEAHAGLMGAAMLTAKLPDIDMRLPGVTHRGATHTAVACGILVALAAAGAVMVTPRMAPVVAGGVAIGYGGHLVADACTPHGVPLLAPVHRRCVHLLPRALRIRTASPRERILVVMLLAMVGLYLWRTYG